MDPARLSKEILEEVEASIGEFAYACQFLQTPIPRTGGMFKTERIVTDTPSKKLVQVIRYWDKAASHDAGCYTAGVKMAKDVTGRFWVLDVVRGRWSSDRREEIIQSTAELDGRGVEIGIEQEGGSGGKESAEGTIRRLAGFRVRADRPVGDKVLRADPFSVQVNSGNVSMVQGEWNSAYTGELQYFPASKYKDQVDASSGAFSLLSKPVKVLGTWR
jgi:predicted phage terminase large subunit-like protein